MRSTSSPGSAERTGNVIQLRGIKARNRTCTCVTDLVRKYKLYGDGVFYLPEREVAGGRGANRAR
jgi:hypothetical protein